MSHYGTWRREFSEPGNHTVTRTSTSIRTDGGTEASVFAVFLTFLKLGFTSFGGPIAHLGYFREEFVVRKRWIEEQIYADLVALCQFTPGPASSKVGIGIGLAKAGLPGAFAAWVGFTLPSAVALVLFAYGVETYAADLGTGWLHGLKVVAVAVVAQAVWGMAKNLTPDARRFTLAVAAAVIAMMWPSSAGQVSAIVVGAVVGFALLRANNDAHHVPMGISVRKGAAVFCLIAFFALLVGLPFLKTAYPSQALAFFDSFYRAGSLVFGGGHVVLPLLQSEVVPTGWVSNDAFLAGYGAAQAVPGPLFTFAAYLGAIMGPEPNGWQGALLCLIAIFLPAFLLVVGVLPFWDDLRRMPAVRSTLTGVNAAVVGLLLAALYNPVWTSAIVRPADFALALVAFALLVFWKVPPWLVVVLSALAGWGLERLAV
jgi:chromate transporter